MATRSTIHAHATGPDTPGAALFGSLLGRVYGRLFSSTFSLLQVGSYRTVGVNDFLRRICK